MHQQLESAFADAKGPKANLLKWATNTSLDHYNQLLAGGSGSGLQYRMAEKLLLRKIWEKLGLDRFVCLSNSIPYMIYDLHRLNPKIMTVLGAQEAFTVELLPYHLTQWSSSRRLALWSVRFMVNI